MAASGTQAAEEVKAQGTCAHLEDNVEYHTSKPIYKTEPAATAAVCCDACESDRRCAAWTWGGHEAVVGLVHQCFLRELGEGERLRRVRRRGVISGLPSAQAKQHGISSQRLKKLVEASGDVPAEADDMVANQTCVGWTTVDGEGKAALVAAAWAAPGRPGARAEVLEGGQALAHFGSRAYLASGCESGPFDQTEYVALELLGKTLRYTTDVAGTGCGCQVSLSLLPLAQNRVASRCGDHFCDAQGTCGSFCAEIALQQSNQYAWSTKLHLHDDAEGVSGGFSRTMSGGSDQDEGRYAPGASCIDTAAPFEVAASFPTDAQGKLAAVEVRLSQAGRSCSLPLRLDAYAAQGLDALAELSDVLRQGVTPVMSYGSPHSPWADGMGPCAAGAAKACPETARFYNLSVAPLARREEPPREPERGEEAPEATSSDMRFRKLETPISKEDERGLLKTLDDADEISEDEFDGAPEWMVVYPGALNVRADKSFDGKILSTKLEGSIVTGRRDGDWLALMREPGFMRIRLQDRVLLRKRMVSYAKLWRGSCADVGKYPIYDANTCQNAGFALGYFDTSVGIYIGDSPRPEGCYIFEGQLWISTSASQIGRGAVGARKPVCSSRSYPTTTTTTTTTSTTSRTTTTRTTSTTRTSTSTTTWGWPSLYCLSVVRTKGYEMPLVKEQQHRGASIFMCDEYSVFSDGGKPVVMGIAPSGMKIMSRVIPPIKKKMGDLHGGATTDSWLNTETFLQVWDIAKKDGKFQRHDWSIKVDPDAVFFPDRLRKKLAPHTRGEDRGLFVMNCDRYNPVALYGSLEIFSKKALQVYATKQWTCRNELPWHGWGEDFFMSHCMDRLGLTRIYDFTLIGDKRCHYAPCTDTSKVVYHDYKGPHPWFCCYNRSMAARGAPGHFPVGGCPAESGR